VRLDAAVAALPVRRVVGDGSVEVTGITHDSRRVRPGDLFCCVRGERADGHDFAPAAVAAGASALLCERDLDLPVPRVVVPDTRAAMGPVADAVFGHPSRRLAVVGVTGTNGKTTTVHLLATVCEHAGMPCGVIGTLTGVRTTPEAPDLQASLAGFVDGGKRAVAMEVSSHALDLHRVDAVRFSVAVFTNLGRDHLDFHETVEAYFRAKARLFEPERSAVGVVNADDPHGRLLLEAARIPTRPFSLADAADLQAGVAGSTFTWQGHGVRLRLGGLFNVTNALAAATAARELGIEAAAIAAGLSAAEPVPGRFERIDVGQPFAVVVDYAHTPEALEQVLRAARGGGGRVIVVFGCGGDRDPTKRPLMGAVAARLADVAVITSDNPRHEDPMAIIADIRAGAAEGGAEVVVEPDRRAAIATALGTARPGDVVVLAGKGHEAVQEVGGRAVPFDDRVVVRELLAEVVR
jgi:UDP-N-acetylmuramoyl-L-alanyl-D-glutamate--2,6-diaminopimelate ligase